MGGPAGRAISNLSQEAMARSSDFLAAVEAKSLKLLSDIETKTLGLLADVDRIVQRLLNTVTDPSWRTDEGPPKPN